MAAPRHVQRPNPHGLQSYGSPDVVPDRWLPQRPGDVPGGFPNGPSRGYPGPDQGYALGLVRLLRDRLHLQAGEHLADVEAGSVALALKRASIFGRAPVVHDLTVAYSVFGFLDENAPSRLVSFRRERFEGVSEPHHYADLRELTQLVAADVLAQSPATVADYYRSDPLGLVRGLKEVAETQ